MIKSLLILLTGSLFLSGSPKSPLTQANNSNFKSLSVATCTGSKSCVACKNCKYCKHCAKEGGTCGVCK